MTPFRIAIAGAGAVVERFHLPAARLCPEVRVVALADQNLRRARALAAKFGIAEVAADYRDLGDGAEGLVIALPNFLHMPATIAFSSRGLPVLVEKPMALRVADAKEMIRVAEVAKAVLAVSLISRQASGARWIKRAVGEGALGAVQSFAIEFGDVFSWQVASSFLFRREQAGGGVLIDLGSHMLDLAVWWFGEPVRVEYRDDAMGGLEAECRVTLEFAGADAPVTGVVCLSRLRTLANTVRIVGSRRTVEWNVPTDTLHVGSSAERAAADVPGFPPPEPRRSLHELFAEQLRAFARAASGLGEPAVSGASALAVVDLIERCYRERGSLELPWTRPALSF